MSSLTPKLFVKRGSAFAMILAAVTALTSCVSSRLVPVMALPAPAIRAMALGNGGAADPWIVTIHFDNAMPCKITHVTEDPATCPTVPLPGFCVARGDRIRWNSDPVGIKYEIYFDPIQGLPLISNANGVLMKPIDPNAPYSLYKYSILGDGCNSDTDTYDPHIRVGN